MPRTLGAARSASASCVKTAARRYSRSKSPNGLDALSGSATPQLPRRSRSALCSRSRSAASWLLAAQAGGQAGGWAVFAAGREREDVGDIEWEEHRRGGGT